MLLLRHHADEFGKFERAVKAHPFFLREFNHAGRHREQGVVNAFFNVFARVNSCSALADEYHAGLDIFSVADFYSQILRL